MVEYLRVFRHVGFFVFWNLGPSQPSGGTAWNLVLKLSHTEIKEASPASIPKTTWRRVGFRVGALFAYPFPIASTAGCRRVCCVLLASVAGAFPGMQRWAGDSRLSSAEAFFG